MNESRALTTTNLGPPPAEIPLAEIPPAEPPPAAAGPSGTVLPPLLASERADQYFDAFSRQLQPIGPIEAFLVRDMARHAAAADIAETTLQSACRETARATAPLLAATGQRPADEDAVMAAVGCCDCVDRTDRRALGRSRGFHRAHDRLRDLQDLRRRRDEMGSTTAVFPFHDERDCERYLADRFRAAQQPCPHCGARRGAYLPSRRAWECGECHRQTGLRGGTVMARSGLPLLTWFRAIAAVLARPTIATAELAEELGIRRKATVRQLARRIREALLADDASERLAGLDNYLCADSEPPEPGVHRNKKAPTMLAHRPSRRRSIEPPHNSQNTAIDAQHTPASST